MKLLAIAIISFFTLFHPGLKQPQRDSEIIKSIFEESLHNGKSYKWLDYLANGIGGRLSGSPEAAAAVEWAWQVMDTLGLDSVWRQPVMVPHWVRGEKEFAKFFSPNYYGEKEVAICALGGSVGTGKDGITAQVIEVAAFEDIAALGKDKIKGKILFINAPMPEEHLNTFHAYGSCVKYRFAGAGIASQYGAAGFLMRSLSLKTDENPHTGVMQYPDDANIPRIPSAAISTLDADLLSQALRNDPELKFHFRMNCKQLSEKLSYNVIGEIKGSEYPKEIIVVGGHLDSWDNGDGAHDDGAGCVHAMEVLRIIKALNIKPKRTIRCVLFMNEENGVRGGKKYAEIAFRNDEKHIAALESDAGGFTPRGFSIDDTSAALRKLKSWAPLFAPYLIHYFEKGYGGVDINPLKEQGTKVIGLIPDSQRYFDVHHAPSDKFETVNKRELELGAAAVTALIYLISEYGIE